MSSSTNFFQGLASYYHLTDKQTPTYSSGSSSYRPSTHTTSYIPLLVGGHTTISSSIHQGPQDWAGRMAYEAQRREGSRQTAAAVIGGVAMVALSAVLAYITKNYIQAGKELKKAEEFKWMLPAIAQEEGFKLSDVLPVVNKHIEIAENKRSQSRNIAALTGVVLAAAAGAFFGGMFAVPWLITASIVVGVFAAATGAFLVVWHWEDETSLPVHMQEQIRTFLREHLVPTEDAV